MKLCYKRTLTCGFEMELLVQMEVRKQKLFARTTRNEPEFVERVTLV
jgi:hypothetical protein